MVLWMPYCPGEGASAPTKVDSYPTHDSMPPILDVESGTLVAFQAQKRGEEANSFECSQVCENDVAQVIIVCEPDLHNNLMGALHPNGALYEAPVNMTVSFRSVLGCTFSLNYLALSPC